LETELLEVPQMVVQVVLEEAVAVAVKRQMVQLVLLAAVAQY
jgi:hypothetical protein